MSIPMDTGSEGDRGLLGLGMTILIF